MENKISSSLNYLLDGTEVRRKYAEDLEEAKRVANGVANVYNVDLFAHKPCLLASTTQLVKPELNVESSLGPNANYLYSKRRAGFSGAPGSYKSDKDKLTAGCI